MRRGTLIYSAAVITDDTPAGSFTRFDRIPSRPAEGGKVRLNRAMIVSGWYPDPEGGFVSRIKASEAGTRHEMRALNIEERAENMSQRMEGYVRNIDAGDQPSNRRKR